MNLNSKGSLPDRNIMVLYQDLEIRHAHLQADMHQLSAMNKHLLSQVAALNEKENIAEKNDIVNDTASIFSANEDLKV